MFDHDFLHVVVDWLLKYGGIILFILLALGIAGIPVPDETILFIAGWMVYTGKLNAFSITFAAIAGAICGITLSYWLGISTGTWFIKKIGPKVGITPVRVQRVHNWFEKIGKWTLLVGYFIPVIRHLTGYVAGSTRLSFHQFALYAYTGAILWSLTFLGLGYFIHTEVTNLKDLTHFSKHITK